MFRSLSLVLFAMMLAQVAPGAEESDLSALVEQLADRDPAKRIAACAAVGALKSKGLPAGAAVCELLLKEKPTTEVWQAASDALEKIAPKVHPRLLDIVLNDDKQGQGRLAAANAIASDLDQAPVALPVLKKLWSEPSNNYKQSSLLQTLHTVAPRDAEVSRVIFLAARGDLEKVLLGSECRVAAIRLVAERDLKDEEINEALFSAVRTRFFAPLVLPILTQRASRDLADPAQVAQECVRLIQSEAKSNRYHPSSIEALVKLGVGAKTVLPELRKLRNHPNGNIRAYVKKATDAIEQAVAVEVPVEGKSPAAGDVWEAIAVNKAGTVSIKHGDRETTIRPVADRTVVFDVTGKPTSDPRAILAALQPGTKLIPQFKGEKIISIRLVE